TQFVLGVATLAIIYACAALAWNLVGGYGGLLSFGHSVYLGLGAYTSGLLFTRFGITPWLGMWAGACVAAIAGGITAYPALRLRGVYFALVSFTATLLFRDLAIHYRDFTGGDIGLSIPYLRDAPQQFQFASQVTYYFVASVALGVFIFVTGVIVRGRLGRFLRATRDDPDAARAAGVDVARVRLIGLMTSAFLTGITGTMLMQYLRFMDPSLAFGPGTATLIALAALVGGSGTSIGPVVGAAILVPLQQILSSSLSSAAAGLSGMAYATVVAGVMLLDRRGIVHLIERALRRGSWLEKGARIATTHPPAVPVVDPHEHAAYADAAPAIPLLRVSDLVVRFGGVTAVDHVSLEIRTGEILGIVGPNGAGKSTLFAAIAGAQRSDAGRIELDGRPVDALPAEARVHAGIARTFQKIRLFRTMSVLETVLVAASGRTSSPIEAEHVALRSLRDAGFSGDTARAATALPLADRKRVEVARALATRPRVLLLDEMMNGLNPAETGELLELVRRVSSSGITVVLVEHVMNVVRSLCSRVIVLNQGRIIAAGTPDGALSEPAVIEAYFGSSAPAEAL
ncbi:MAG: branched-chain amino acid ABC transporter ATP-binding protein/permease, partial [Chloroflexota bacterium]|nr:branched-chain amino acid ABC transporter ATP-binding protein/permease [Chloroflexota bacterium]